MVGAIIGAAAQVGSSIYGAIKSSQANKRAEQLLRNQRDENQKWYETRMAQDYTRRADVQNVLRKQRELFNEQYQKARGASIVAGGTDESLALQQAQANKTMGDTMGDIAAQAEDYKEAVEQQYREADAQLDQKEIALEQQKAQNIANAAGQMGSAVGGLMMGNIDKEPEAGDSYAPNVAPAAKIDNTPAYTAEGLAEKQLKEQLKGGAPKITV